MEYLQELLQNEAIPYHNEDQAKFVDEYGYLLTTAQNPHGASKNVLLPNWSLLADGKKAGLKGSIKLGSILKKKYTIIDAEASELITNGVIDSNKNYPYTGAVGLVDDSGNVISGSQLKYLGPEAYGEYGNFAIYAGTKKDGIQFGVRLDGTVFMKRAQLTGVRIVFKIDQYVKCFC